MARPRSSAPKAVEPKSIAKASCSKAATARRHKTFVERYLVNGNNATDAAKVAGYSAKTAYSAGQRLLKHPDMQALLGNRAEEVVTRAKLTTERWAEEMAGIGHFDPGELYDAVGNLIPIHQLPEHVRRAIASVETGPIGKAVKIKFWDKNAALANIGKHLGVYERDNHQKLQAIQVVVELVG